MAGRLATEARALWQMQNSTVQWQEALVVSPCRARGVAGVFLAVSS